MNLSFPYVKILSSINEHSNKNTVQSQLTSHTTRALITYNIASISSTKLASTNNIANNNIRVHGSKIKRILIHPYCYMRRSQLVRPPVRAEPDKNRTVIKVISARMAGGPHKNCTYDGITIHVNRDSSHFIRLQFHNADGIYKLQEVNILIL